MASTFDAMKDEENLKGVSALAEVAAMARVGVLSAGSGLVGQAAGQREKDAARQARRGKVARATALDAEAQRLRQMRKALVVQREKEQIRPLTPPPEAGLLQGRATQGGFGKAGLTVKLVDADGAVLDETTSKANGAFLLRDTARAGTGRIVVSDAAGTVLGRVAPPAGARDGTGFLDLPLERLRGGGPVDSDAPPPEDEEKEKEREAEGIEVPDLVGTLFARVARNLPEGLVPGAVALTRLPQRAGEVIGQSPAAGRRAKEGSAVALEVATGAEEADFETARILVRAHPAVAKADLPPGHITQAENKAGIKGLSELRKLPERSAAAVAELIPGGRRAHAKAWIVAVRDVLARFPDG